MSGYTDDDMRRAQTYGEERERAYWEPKARNAMLQIEHLGAHIQALTESIVDGQAFLPPAPMIIQGDAVVVAAERERCAKIAEGYAARDREYGDTEGTAHNYDEIAAKIRGAQ